MSSEGQGGLVPVTEPPGEAAAPLTRSRPTRLLRPSSSRLRPFPKRTALALGVAWLLSVPGSPGGGEVLQALDAIAKIGASLALCALATWAEQRLYKGLLGAKRLTRLLLTLFVPFLLTVLTPLAAMVAGLAAIAGDDGTLAMAVLLGGAWMASAAAGTTIMVGIDVAISALIDDFRSRIQAAVLILLLLVAGLALGVFAGARSLTKLGLEALPNIINDESRLTVAGKELDAEQLRALVSNPETVDLVVLVLVLLVAVMALPAILSACGKLADGVMERLDPLVEAFDEIGAGRLDLRVEEGGSLDLLKLTQGFNRMVQSLGDTLSDLDVRNRDLADMNRATSRFVPFQFLELLAKDSIREIERGDQVRLDISILFSDIRGFTTMAEQMGPEATFGFINRYLGHMEAEIHREQGFINDIFGDGIMALFHRGADAALRAALGMLAALARFNDTLATEDREPVRMGIGMNSGLLMLGTIGGGERLSCTVVGDPANAAARVEGMTKLYGASLLISDATYQRLEDPSRYELREIDQVRAKGKRAPMVIYEVLDGEPAAVREQKVRGREAFASALADYRGGRFAEARRSFEALHADAPDDAACALYVERCGEQIAVPPAHWDGVTELLTK